MMRKIAITSKGENYAAATIGSLHQLNEHVFHLAPGIDINGKVFVGETLECTGTEISFATIDAGKGSDFIHTHRSNEETYIILKGKGNFRVDNSVFDVSEGSVIRVSPNGKRALRNNGADEMVFICIQSKVNTLHDLGITDGVISSEEVKW